MNKIPKNLLLPAIILTVILPINLIGVRLDYSRATFVGEVKDSAEESNLSVSTEKVEDVDLVDLKTEPKIEANLSNVEESLNQDVVEPESVDNVSVDNVNDSQATDNGPSVHEVAVETNSTVDRSRVCLGDLNNDGQVNGDDVRIVLDSWSHDVDNSESSIADLNNDGIVDGSDLGTVLGHWGDCPGKDSRGTCLGDLNNDGQVNGDDVRIVLDSWSHDVDNSESSIADLNNDGIVDGSDLGTVLGHWGDCSASLNNSDETPGPNFIQNFTGLESALNGVKKIHISTNSDLSPTGIGNTADEPIEDEGDDNGNNGNEGDNGNNGGGGNDGGGSGGGSSSSNKRGEVLGASDINNELVVVAFSQCNEAYLKDYIKYGANNNPEEVKKLQTFLNNRGAGLPVTGFYGEKTLEAVKDFQRKFNKLILKPWFDAGLLPDDTQPTGYVYETTRFWINAMTCGGVKNLTLPKIR